MPLEGQGSPGTVEAAVYNDTTTRGALKKPTKDTSNNTEMQDVVGAKDDSAATGAVSEVESLMAYAKQNVNSGVLAFGTLTTSSVTVPADSSRSEANGYWDGCWLVTASGAQVGKPVRIASFANSGGVFTVDTEQPFDLAPGTVAYAIIGGPSALVPATDSTANQFMEQVVGSKVDAAAAGTPSSVESIIAYAKQLVVERLALTDKGKTQVIEVSITAAANAGVTTVATITTQPCVIESIVVHADAAQTGDLTSIAVKGGASQVVQFISASVGAQANLDAADKQVAWTGVARFAATKTIIIDLQGTGATALNLTVTIVYRAAVDGGTLV